MNAKLCAFVGAMGFFMVLAAMPSAVTQGPPQHVLNNLPFCQADRGADNDPDSDSGHGNSPFLNDTDNPGLGGPPECGSFSPPGPPCQSPPCGPPGPSPSASPSPSPSGNTPQGGGGGPQPPGPDGNGGDGGGDGDSPPAPPGPGGDGPPGGGGEGPPGPSDNASPNALASALLPLLLFAGTALLSLFGMTANSPARLSMQHMLPVGTRTAWVKIVDPETEEALMTVSMHPAAVPTLEDDAAVAAQSVTLAESSAAQQVWSGEFGVTRTGPVAMLLYASGDAGPRLHEDLGLIDQHDGQIYFESEFAPDDEGLSQGEGPDDGTPPDEAPAEVVVEEPVLSVAGGGQETAHEVRHEGWSKTLREVFK